MIQDKSSSTSLIEKYNPDCRFKHYKRNSPVSGLVYCDSCRAYVEKGKKNSCECCTHKVAGKKKNLWLKRILNEGRKQLSKDMEKWCVFNEDFYNVKTFKDKAKYINKMVYIKIDGGLGTKTVYELPMRLFVLSQQGIQDEQSILEMVREKVVIKGFEI